MSIINARLRKNGIGTASHPEKFLEQDFQHRKQFCQIQMFRYIDEMFPPDRGSIGQGVLDPELMSKVEWLRPHVSVLPVTKAESQQNESLIHKVNHDANQTS